MDWRKADRIVRNLRYRSFRAAQANDLRKVRSLQKLMMRCHSNILMSVRRVTQVNAGKNTPGVDKVVVKTPAARGQLVDYLATRQPWRASPVRRVYIPKANGKQRPLGIPTVLDRALQAMVKQALEPEWEAHFEGSSYGFRPGRSCHDAIAKIYSLARPNKRKRWVVDADIKGAFDNIDHDFLLRAIGEAPGRELVRQWLKAGVMEDGSYHATETGTPQGGVISPLLANMVLDGLEHRLADRIRQRKTTNGKVVYNPKINLIRYADDLVVTGDSPETLAKVKEIVVEFLAERGLELSPEKTRIVPLSEGFNFLGQNVRLYGDKVLIKPSKEALAKIYDKIRGIVRRNKSVEQRDLIRMLNAVNVQVLNPVDPANRQTLMVGGLLIVAAVVGKFLAGYAPFWFKGNKKAIGVGMIPRGEVGLIFAQMGLASGVFDPGLFSATTLMVMVTTFIAPPLLKLVFPPVRPEQEPPEPEGIEELVTKP
jgi:RNA-directed DNA polymerase